MSKFSILLHSCSVVVALALSAPAMSQTLKRALELAYENNPDLKVRRLQMRGVDEQVPQARSAMLPNLSLTSNIGINNQEYFSPDNVQDKFLEPVSFGITLNQRLYDFGRTSNRVDAAVNSALAARANVWITEQQVLLNSVTQYANLVRDRALVKLREDSIAYLKNFLEETRARAREGLATEADINQIEGQIANVEANLLLLSFNAEITRENFEQVIGASPDALTEPSPYFAEIPMNSRAAKQIAFLSHPSIRNVNYLIDAAEAQVRAVEADFSPILSFQASYQRLQRQFSSHEDYQVSRAILQLSWPIFDGGLSFSRARAAKELLAQRRAELDVVRAQLNIAAESSFNFYESTRSRLEKFELQVKFSEKALDAIKSELANGRTFRLANDVLASENALFNARAGAINLRRDVVVASYQMLASLGRLTAKQLNLNVAFYDDTSHYERVNAQWFGSDILD